METCFLETCLIPALGKEMYKMNIEHIVIPKIKETIKDYSGKSEGLRSGLPLVADMKICTSIRISIAMN